MCRLLLSASFFDKNTMHAVVVHNYGQLFCQPLHMSCSVSVLECCVRNEEYFCRGNIVGYCLYFNTLGPARARGAINR